MPRTGFVRRELVVVVVGEEIKQHKKAIPYHAHPSGTSVIQMKHPELILSLGGTSGVDSTVFSYGY